MKLNAGQVEQAISYHVDWRRCLLIPEAHVRYKTGKAHPLWDGKVYEYHADYRADFMLVTDSGYATELEVKVSRADWRVDATKDKWGRLPPWISRFVYVVPEALGIPDWVRPEAGVWHVVDGQPLRIKVARAPKRMGAEKIPESVKQHWLRNLYYRFWNQRHDAYRRMLDREAA